MGLDMEMNCVQHLGENDMSKILFGIFWMVLGIYCYLIAAAGWKFMFYGSLICGAVGCVYAIFGYVVSKEKD